LEPGRNTFGTPLATTRGIAMGLETKVQSKKAASDSSWFESLSSSRAKTQWQARRIH